MIHLIEVLAALALAAAGGLRTSLTLLVLALASLDGGYGTGNLGGVLTVPPVFAALSVWAMLELVATKTALGQRAVQGLQFFVAPFAGTILAVAYVGPDTFVQQCIVGGAGGALAALLQAVSAGYFFRRGPIPARIQTLQDLLCTLLVLLALGAPLLGGVFTLALLWAALKQSYAWRMQFNRSNRFA